MDTAAPDTPVTDPETGEPIYAYKRSLIGGAYSFRLKADALEWSMGPRMLRVPYESVRRVRMSYKPMTMQNYRFVTEIWSANAPKAEISSSSWKSLVEQERLDAAYRGFVIELHRRLAQSAPQARYTTGVAPALYWPGVLLLVGLGAAFVWLLGQALLQGQLGGAALVAVFLAVIVWQMGNFFLRNRPGTYRPDAPPEIVLPKPKKN